MNCGALLCHQRSGYIDRLHEVKKNMQILSKWRDQQSLKNSATSMYVTDNYIMHPM